MLPARQSHRLSLADVLPAGLDSLSGRDNALSLPRADSAVVVEHVLGPWVDLVDRLLVLSADGRLVADGPVRETLAGERERSIIEAQHHKAGALAGG